MDIGTILFGWHWSELLAVLFGLAYVILAARENIWCWFWGILSCTLWAWATFALYDLYIDALLQVFYVIMGFIGWYQWSSGGNDTEELPISVYSWPQHLAIICVGSGLAFIVGYFFESYTSAAATYIDAWTTIFAIITTFMVIGKKLENWLYWIVIDAIYVGLYIDRGGFPFAALYIVYVVIAVYGYIEWRRRYKAMGI